MSGAAACTDACPDACAETAGEVCEGQTATCDDAELKQTTSKTITSTKKRKSLQDVGGDSTRSKSQTPTEEDHKQRSVVRSKLKGKGLQFFGYLLCML